MEEDEPRFQGSDDDEFISVNEPDSSEYKPEQMLIDVKLAESIVMDLKALEIGFKFWMPTSIKELERVLNRLN